MSRDDKPKGWDRDPLDEDELGDDELVDIEYRARSLVRDLGFHNARMVAAVSAGKTPSAYGQRQAKAMGDAIDALERTWKAETSLWKRLLLRRPT